MSIEQTKAVLPSKFAEEMVKAFEEHKMSEFDHLFSEVELNDDGRGVWTWKITDRLFVSLEVYPVRCAFRVAISRWTSWREDIVKLDTLSSIMPELRAWLVLK